MIEKSRMLEQPEQLEHTIDESHEFVQKPCSVNTQYKINIYLL